MHLLHDLPPFKSLLVRGPYIPSAPIRLSLSVPAPDLTIFFSSSRDAVLQTIHSDEWLTSNAGTGSVASMSTRVTLFYPPSPSHLLALLAMLRTHDASSPSIPFAPNASLDRPPALLVLHEPSAYFLQEQQEYTLSSYLLLIVHALETIEHLTSLSSSPTTARFVVFDTGLDRLRLPVLRSPRETTFGERDGPEDAPRPESVLLLAEKYFELSGTFQSFLPVDERTKSDTPAFVLHRSGQDLVQVSEGADVVVD